LAPGPQAGKTGGKLNHRGTENTEVNGPQDAPRDPLTERIIGLAIEVHKVLGPGLLESAYEECLCYELSANSLVFRRQVPLPVTYKSVQLDCAYRADVIVEGQVLLELKAIERLMPIHRAQLLSYLRLSGLKTGLLLNFHVPLLRDGLVRMVL
jgi:GxxExxY protein